MPTVPASLSLAIALVVTDTEAVAESVMDPPWRSSPGGPRVAFDLISAEVVKVAIVRASEPAMPSLPLPAPAVDSVSSVRVVQWPANSRIADRSR